MIRNLAMAALLAAGLSLAAQQVQTPPPNSQDTGIKQDTSNAAHSTGRAAKKTGRKIKHGTQHAVHTGAQETSRGANKVEKKSHQHPQNPQ